MMPFNEPIMYGRFIKRYQRFFMDILMDDGSIVTAHTPNTGSMMGLLEPNSRVMLSKSLDPKRRLSFTAQAIHINNTWVGINTHLPNKLVKSSLSHPLLKELHHYGRVKAEARYGKDLRSRVDLYLSDHPNKAPVYLEIKNVTLKIGASAQFPDAVSTRAQKHIEDLLLVKEQGFNSSLIFIVQRSDCQFFTPARHIDSDYADLLTRAHSNGISIRALSTSIDENGLSLSHEIPCQF